jgi:hypothetical protein
MDLAPNLTCEPRLLQRRHLIEVDHLPAILQVLHDHFDEWNGFDAFLPLPQSGDLMGSTALSHILRMGSLSGPSKQKRSPWAPLVCYAGEYQASFL